MYLVCWIILKIPSYCSIIVRKKVDTGAVSLIKQQYFDPFTAFLAGILSGIAHCTYFLSPYSDGSCLSHLSWAFHFVTLLLSYFIEHLSIWLQISS